MATKGGRINFMFLVPPYLAAGSATVISLFWTSGDVSFGFQSQSGQPYLHLAEAYMIFDTELTFCRKRNLLQKFIALNVNSAIIYHFLCKHKKQVFTPNKHFEKENNRSSYRYRNRYSWFNKTRDVRAEQI